MAGRMSCGLPLGTTEFASLAPRFYKEGGEIMTAEQWQMYVPGWDRLPMCFKGTVPYLLASVVYHRVWLRENLPSQHPLFQSRFWKEGMPERLGSYVLAGKFRCEKTMMTATGLPSHLVLAQRLETLEEQLVEFQNRVHNQHTQIMTDLPSAVANVVLERVQVNGAVAVTATDFNTFRSEILGVLKAGLSANVATPSPTSQSSPLTVDVQGSDRVCHIWSNGSMHRTPEGFIFPQDTCKGIYDSWFFGNASLKIGPFRFFSGLDLGKNTDKVQYSRVKAVVLRLGEIATANSFIPAECGSKLAKCTRIQSDTVFDKSFVVLAKEIGLTSARPGETNYGTVYNKMCIVKKASAASAASVASVASAASATPAVGAGAPSAVSVSASSALGALASVKGKRKSGPSQHQQGPRNRPALGHQSADGLTSVETAQVASTLAASGGGGGHSLNGSS
jgi:hypothetical protein